MSLDTTSFQIAFEVWPTPAMLLNREMIIEACNRAYEEASRSDRNKLIGRHLFEAFPGGDESQAALLQQSFERVLRTQKPDHLADFTYAIRSKNNAHMDLRRWTVSNVPLFAETGEITAILHCPLEITGLVKFNEPTQQSLNHDTGSPEASVPISRQMITVLDVERKRLQQLFHQAPGFICVLRGPQHHFELANAAYYQLVGHREIIDYPVADVIPEVVRQGFLDRLDGVYKTGIPFIGRAMPLELQRVAASALELRYVDFIYQPILDHDQKVTGIFVQGNDVTEAYALAQAVTYQAAHDSLTGLINRREFSRLTNEISSKGPHALLYLDMDHFKIVNDRCGHAAGDSLLKEVTAQLAAAADDGIIVARLGGDEFAIVMTNCDDKAAFGMAEKLRAAVKNINFIWDGKSYRITLSVGIAMFSIPDGPPFDVALGLADAACFLAKDAGRDRTKIGSASDEDLGQQRLIMDDVTRLQHAIDDNRIELFAQRIHSFQSNPADPPKAYFEILARLRDVDGGLISPAGFIPAAEKYKLIEGLDRHIISQAVGFIQAYDFDGPNLCIFINLSAVTLSSVGFYDFVAQLMEEHSQVSPTQICFEVTETAAISNMGRSVAAMERLTQLGIRFALDDFGSGMASFAYLQQLPIHFVKIDGEFIKSVSGNTASPIIVDSVVRIAMSMGIQTIAESIEDEEIVPMLQELGVHYGQGFALHRPEPLVKALCTNLKT